MFSVDPILDLISRRLDACALRQGVYAANIANANTPGYHPLEVDFETQLDRSSSSMAGAPFAQRAAMMQMIEPRVVPAAADSVELDQQMALMTKNALQYQSLIGGFERSIGLLRLAVLEGREG
jgi:flagellar basal-body rod protein FlgB